VSAKAESGGSYTNEIDNHYEDSHTEFRSHQIIRGECLGDLYTPILWKGHRGIQYREPKYHKTDVQHLRGLPDG
jgi:hypothetical protein